MPGELRLLPLTKEESEVLRAIVAAALAVTNESVGTDSATLIMKMKEPCLRSIQTKLSTK